MIVPKDILVPIDFSDASKAALQWAVGFGQSCNASLHLLHVLESVTGVDRIAIPMLTPADAPCGRRAVATTVRPDPGAGARPAR